MEEKEAGKSEVICDLGKKGCCIAPFIKTGKTGIWFKDGMRAESVDLAVQDYRNCPVVKAIESKVGSNRTIIGSAICPELEKE